MSDDPYGQNPSDQNPYGQPNPNPYGQQPPPNPYSGQGDSPSYGQYGQPASSGGQSPYGQNYYSPGQPQTTGQWDGLTITGFVFSFLCFLGWIGVILGIIGIKRTKNEMRRGRGLAIAAIIIGSIMTLGCLALGGFILWAKNNSINLDNAKVGQCVDIRHDGNKVSLLKWSCSSTHDGEIVYVGTFGDVTNLQNISPSDTTDLAAAKAICSQLVDPAAKDNLTSASLDWGIVLKDVNSTDPSNKLACYVENDGNLTSDLLK